MNAPELDWKPCQEERERFAAIECRSHQRSLQISAMSEAHELRQKAAQRRSFWKGFWRGALMVALLWALALIIVTVGVFSVEFPVIMP